MSYRLVSKEKKFGVTQGGLEGEQCENFDAFSLGLEMKKKTYFPIRLKFSGFVGTDTMIMFAKGKNYIIFFGPVTALTLFG